MAKKKKSRHQPSSSHPVMTKKNRFTGLIRHISFFFLLFLVLWSPYFRGLYFEYERFPFYVAFFVLAVFWWGWRGFVDAEKTVSFPVPAGFLLFLSLLYLVTIPWAADRGLAFREFLSVFTFFMVFLVAMDLAVSEKHKRMALLLFALNGVLMIVLAVSSRFGWIPLDARPLGMSMFDLFLSNRLASHLQYPNTAAAYFIMGFFAVLVLAVTERTKWLRLILFAVPFILFTGFFLTYSRGALLTFPLALVVLVFFFPREKTVQLLGSLIVPTVLWFVLAQPLEGALGAGHGGAFFGWFCLGTLASALGSYGNFQVLGHMVRVRPKRWLLPGIGIAAGVLLVAALIAFYTDLLPLTLSGRVRSIGFQVQSAFARIQFYRDAWRMMLERPLLGWGGRAWETLYLTYRSSFYTARSTHNYYIQVLVDVGWVGILMLGAFLFTFFREGWRKMRELDGSRGAVLAGMLGMAAMGFLHSMIDFNFSLGAFQFALWFMVGLAAWHFKDKIFFGSLNLGKIRVEIPFVTCLFFLILTAFLMPGPRYQQRGDWQVEARNWPGAIFQYRRAASRDPWNAAVHHSLSRVLREQFMATRQGYFFVESREAGERAREIAPRNPQYAENLGVIMLEMGNQEAGLELLREAVSLSPLDATFYEKLMQGYGAAGNRAVRDGDRSLAREYYQEGLAVREQFDQAAARSTEPVRQRGTIDQLHAELESLLEELGADEGERLAEP